MVLKRAVLRNVLRFSSIVSAIASASLYIAYISVDSCSEADWAIALSSFSIVFGVAALVITVLRMIENSPLQQFQKTWLLELAGVLASTLFFASLAAGYTVRFTESCTVNSEQRPHLIRESVLLAAVVQTATTICYAAITHHREHLSATIVSVVGTVLAIGAVVLVYMHGGKTMDCGALKNQFLDDEFKIIVWVVAISSACITAAYILQRFAGTDGGTANMSATFIWGIAGSGLAIVTGFFLSLIVDDDRKSCPFILEQDDRGYGNAALYMLLAAMALQHTTPAYSRPAEPADSTKLSQAVNQQNDELPATDGGGAQLTAFSVL